MRGGRDTGSAWQEQSRCLFLLNLVLLYLLGWSSVVRADGIRNPFQGAAAIAQGNAFAAQADDPTAVFYNPAGMTQLHGIQHTAGVQFVSVNTHFTSPTGVSIRNDQPFPIGLPPPGQLFITANLKDLGVRALGDLSVGLGLQNLFGFAAKYPRNGPFASAVTFAQFPLIDIKPTFAYKVTDRLSIGLGADIFTFVSFLGEGHLEQQSIQGGSTVELNGKGDVDPVPRQLLTRAEGFFDGLFFLTLSDKLTRGQVAK